MADRKITTQLVKSLVMAPCVSSDSTCCSGLRPLVLRGYPVLMSLDATCVCSWDDQPVLGCLTTP